MLFYLPIYDFTNIQVNFIHFLLFLWKPCTLYPLLQIPIYTYIFYYDEFRCTFPEEAAMCWP